MPSLQLHNQLFAAGIPVRGVSIGVVSDKKTWRIDYKPEATAAQKQAAAQAVKSFDWDAAGQQQVRREKYERISHLKTIKAEAMAAGDNDVADEIQKEIDALTP